MEGNVGFSEQAFQQAKDDALATHAPKGVIFGSGFLAGFVITWLPLVVYLVLFVWEALFGSVIPGESKLQAALANLWQGWAGYASVAWLASIVIGGLGVLLAYLRALSCLVNWYIRFQTRNGEFRLGLHQVLGLIGIPVIGGIVLNYTIGDPQVFYIMLIPIAISGLIFNMLFQSLQTSFLRRLHPVDHLHMTIEGLKVFVPRHVGSNHAQIDEIRIDSERNLTEVFGTFDSDATRQEVRQIVSHFLRGYDPIHVRDVESSQAS